MKASLQPKPMYCSRDYYYSSRFNQQYEKLTPTSFTFKAILKKVVSSDLSNCGFAKFKPTVAKSTTQPSMGSATQEVAPSVTAAASSATTAAWARSNDITTSPHPKPTQITTTSNMRGPPKAMHQTVASQGARPLVKWPATK